MSRLPSAPPILSGYSYVRPLGAGGFADVFLFEQNTPRRPVAVKVLLQDVVDSDVLRMFNAEADVMARLSAHSSILTVFNASISADGRPYLVMEFCPGSPAQTYRRVQSSVPEVLSLAVKIACALETAHRSGVLHRDIKPSNILISTLGNPVLADFGIAASLASIDREQLIAMSVPWSAPEVVGEQTSGTVATEVWSFGATIYSLLAGRPPFEMPDGTRISRDAQRARIKRAKYTPIERTDVPPALEEFLARTMGRNPGHRQRTLLECATELQQIQQSLGLLPTALEVAVDEWAAGGSPIDFNNTAVPGPVITVVPIDSRRAKRQGAPALQHTNEGTRLVDSGERRHGGPALRQTLLLASVSVLSVAATLGVLTLTGAL